VTCTVLFWIDTVCINQDDVEERSAEVSRMGTIYSRAHQVIIWLGPEFENSSLAIETLRSIGKDVRYKFTTHSAIGSGTALLQQDPKAISAKETEWVAIRNLLYRKWFTRLWILQEIKLSRQAVVIVESSELPLDMFRSSIHWISHFVATSSPVSNTVDLEHLDKYIFTIIDTVTIIHYLQRC
jgi:hypothetical protein